MPSNLLAQVHSFVWRILCTGAPAIEALNMVACSRSSVGLQCRWSQSVFQWTGWSVPKHATNLPKFKFERFENFWTSLRFAYGKFAVLEPCWGSNSSNSEMSRLLEVWVWRFQFFLEIVRKLRAFKIYLRSKFKKFEHSRTVSRCKFAKLGSFDLKFKVF